MIRVLLADDHAVVRVGLRRILETADGIRVVGEAATGDEALERLASIPVDVLVLDISMPGPGLLEVLRRAGIARPAMKTLVLSIHGEDQYAVRALRSGAAGYLTKERSPEELVDAVRQVHAGRTYATPAIAARLSSPRRGKADRAAHEALSPREFEVFRLLGIGRSIKVIARELSLSPKTISTFRARVLKKLGFSNNAGIVRYVIENGLDS